MNNVPKNLYNKTPILILGFNRPNLLQELINRIKVFEPEKIYISIDGARKNNTKDKKLIEKIKKIVLNEITWDCDLKTKFFENNYGVKNAPVKGINWLFENEEMGIILEDDVNPDISFFPFITTLLNKYKYDHKIMMISGNNYIYSKNKIKENYYFSKSPGTHGWATWKRSWKKFDLSMMNFTKFDFFKILYYFNFNLAKTHYFYKRFLLCKNDKIQAWDYQHFYSIINNNGLIIKPNINLCKHIGWELETGEESTHGKGADGLPDVINQPMTFPIVHPRTIGQNYAFDNIEDKKLRKLFFFKYFFYLISKKLKLIT